MCVSCAKMGSLASETFAPQGFGPGAVWESDFESFVIRHPDPNGKPKARPWDPIFGRPKFRFGASAVNITAKTPRARQLSTA